MYGCLSLYYMFASIAAAYMYIPVYGKEILIGVNVFRT